MVQVGVRIAGQIPEHGHSSARDGGIMRMPFYNAISNSASVNLSFDVVENDRFLFCVKQLLNFTVAPTSMDVFLFQLAGPASVLFYETDDSAVFPLVVASGGTFASCEGSIIGRAASSGSITMQSLTEVTGGTNLVYLSRLMVEFIRKL